MAKTISKEKQKKKVETLTHKKASRLNIPTAEYQSVMRTEELSPIQVAYQRRNRDLDPQLVWRGKDERDWSDLVVPASPLYIQEKVQPKVLIDDLQRRSEANAKASEPQIDLFANFNGLPSEAAKTEFYQHDAHWANRMILGDSLQVMASLAEREGLRGKVQCIYIDPPYGIKFNSNFQWSTTSRDVKDGNIDHITREPEQVKAFRDTWRDGIHSYLTYLRDRLTVARDLLAESGSVFMQIGDENVHRVRSLMEEIFGEKNFVSQIVFRTTTGKASAALDSTRDFLIWFARNIEQLKFRRLYFQRLPSSDDNYKYEYRKDGTLRPLNNEELSEIDARASQIRIAAANPLTSQSSSSTTLFEYDFAGTNFKPGKGGWKTNLSGMENLRRACRLYGIGKTLRYIRPISDFDLQAYNDIWDDTRQSGFGDSKLYVVQTATSVIERCILMTTDPGDLVLDPTCGSGTSAFVAEQWGRRWITTDTSRVALALARARIMGARYPYYLLADSREGQIKEGEITGKAYSEMPTHSDVRQGFVYQRVPHITLRSIANNSEIEVIWDEYQGKLEPLRQQLNQELKTKWQEWEIPRDADERWSSQAKQVHTMWRNQKTARQQAIDASIASKAEFEYLYDKPYEDNKKVRVAGPFTVESLSPHRVLDIGDDDELLQKSGTSNGDKDDEADFIEMILENLKTSGVQQAHKEDKITFSSIVPWPGYFVCAEGKYTEGNGKAGTEKRAAIFIGPEFGTVSRPDLVAAAREAGDAGFDVLITCAFNYDAHSSEFNKLGKIPVLKARMNADLHMSDELKNTGKGNLFVIFGEPDIEILKAKNGQIQVKVIGVDVFHPTTGEVRSDGAEGIACWFVDSDYNEESFFVRQAYFLGANDPYKALRTTLKAEINEEAWATLHSDISRPFDKPKSERIAIKVINHLGDEVMKVFKV
jgi:adenine-specific DNA-methyltransferase